MPRERREGGPRVTAALPQGPSGARGAPGAPAVQGSLAPVARLNQLATALAERPLGPRAEFRADLRARLLAEVGCAGPVRRGGADSTPDPTTERALPDAGGLLATLAPAPAGREPVPAVTRRRPPRGRRAAAVGLAVVLTGGGVAAAAAAHSLPGEPLYPAKRAGQSAELALDPSSGAGPALQLLSARISDVERTLNVDPDGHDGWRWRAVDTAVEDASRALDGLAPSSPPDRTAAALTQSRTRLDRLLVAVPAAARPAVQGLLDAVDALLPAPPVPGGSGLLASLLPALQLPSLQRLSPSDALAAGWPLELPAAARAQPLAVAPGGAAAPPGGVEQRPVQSVRRHPSRPASAANPSDGATPTRIATPTRTSTSTGSTPTGASSAATRTSGDLGQVSRPTGEGTRTSSRPGIGDTVEHAVDDSLGTTSGLLRDLAPNGSSATR